MKFYNKSSFKRINRKNLIISICIIILILLLIIIFSLYIANQNIRDFFDIYLFKKNISSSNSNKIDFNDDESTFVFAYDKYVAVLNKNTFSAYNSSSNKAFNLTTELNNPISSSANRFIALAEKDGQKAIRHCCNFCCCSNACSIRGWFPLFLESFFPEYQFE